MNTNRIKKFNKFNLLNTSINEHYSFDDIYDLYTNSNIDNKAELTAAINDMSIGEIQDVIEHAINTNTSNMSDFISWLKLTILKQISSIFAAANIVEDKPKSKGDFTQTMFSNVKEFIIRVYDQDGEVAHTEKVEAKDKESAELIAIDVINNVEGYDESEGWDYMVL